MKTALLVNILLVLSILSGQAQLVTTATDAGPGSLRQAIMDSNNGLGSGEIVFNLPLSDPGFDAQRGVFTIRLTTALPPVTRAHSFINGTSQTSFTGNTNNTLLRAGGNVGAQGLSLRPVRGPEIEIIGDSTIRYGLLVSAPHVKILGLSLYGFGQHDVLRSGSIVIDQDGTSAWIEGNCLGTYADRVEDPGAERRTRGSNITGSYADSVVIKDNLIAWAGVAGIFASDHADYWRIEGNEIVFNNQIVPRLDGIDLARNQHITISQNRIAHNKGNGIDTYRTIGNHTIVNNTIERNGEGGLETSGIRLFGLDNHVRHNTISENEGSGILVTSSAQRNTLSQNAIFQNGARSQHPFGIDLISAQDDHDRGTTPFFTRNDRNDIDEGGNGLLNCPIIDKTLIRGDSLFVEGWAPPGATLEFFVGDSAESNFPQGKQYVFQLVEGSPLDQDATYTRYDFPGSWGTDSTHRFAIGRPLPPTIREGTPLVATATLNGSTSEFSPKSVASARHLLPIAGCTQTDGNGHFEVLLGYHNYSSDTITIADGPDNFFSSSDTPPTLFYPGTHQRVASMSIDSSGGQWVLQGNALTVSYEQNRCPIDLGITLEANKELVYSGDTVWVTVIVENISSAVGHHVTTQIVVPAHASLVSLSAAQGDYQANNSEWNIGQLLPGQRTTLALQLLIRENTLVKATVNTPDQPDEVLWNNEAIAHVAVSESSSGEDGGTESNGNLASKIAVRNFQRQQQPSSATRSVARVFTHADVRAGKITKASGGLRQTRTYSQQHDLLLIPENTSASSRALIVTPDDLIGITNAHEVFSVDYLNQHQQVLGALLYVRTRGAVYEHTKAICDRLKGGALTDIRHVYIQGKPFILSRIDQPNGDIDYAVNFVAYEEENGYTIDNRWRNEEYHPDAQSDVLNFQVWSVSPAHAVALVDDILTAMSHERDVTYQNLYPATIPAVYVRTGYYAQGQLHLTLANALHAQNADVWGTTATTEDGERTAFLTSAALPPGESLLSLPVSQVFDAGFTLANNRSGGLDALYLADGPWGIDYEQNGASIAEFRTEASLPIDQAGVYPLERSARMAGDVRTYASLFRCLRPGMVPQNLQAYTHFVFEASGVGDYEVILSKNSIKHSAEQFRYRFKLSKNIQQFTVPFAALTNRYGEAQGKFSAEDITAVVFNALGNEKSHQPFRLHIDHAAFYPGNQLTVAGSMPQSEDNQVLVYPNPAHNQVTVSVRYGLSGEEVKATLMDLSGRQLLILGTGRTDRAGGWQVSVPVSVPSGMYLLRVETPRTQQVFKFIRQ